MLATSYIFGEVILIDFCRKSKVRSVWKQSNFNSILRSGCVSKKILLMLIVIYRIDPLEHLKQLTLFLLGIRNINSETNSAVHLCSSEAKNATKKKVYPVSFRSRVGRSRNFIPWYIVLLMQMFFSLLFFQCSSVRVANKIFIKLVEGWFVKEYCILFVNT